MTPPQRTIVERALALAEGSEDAAISAPGGQIIGRCEPFRLGPGRDFLRRAPEDTLHARDDALEEKPRPAGPAAGARRAGTRGDRRGRS